MMGLTSLNFGVTMNNFLYSLAQIADILSVGKTVIQKWEESSVLKPTLLDNKKLYDIRQLSHIDVVRNMLNSQWDNDEVKPLYPYSSIELFAGAGGLALGLEKAGFHPKMLNEIDKDACNTLKKNRPNWNVVHQDVSKIDFTPFHNKIDFLSGGFPCQSFSYAGKGLGFDDVRGTLFYEFARAVKEVNPKIFLAENVKGLLSHDNGATINTIKSVLSDLGYEIIPPRILKAIFYRVPQKRERLLIIGIRKDVFINDFVWPEPYKRIMTLKDAFYKGDLFDCDVPQSQGQKYPLRKAEIMSHVPQGGYWRDLPDELQREYMQKSYFLGGGKTGMARRLSLEEPSLTLTCAPAQKQTERCHPLESRPLTIREYARIQTFPDSWEFSGSMTNIYKQIGNAVPVNLAYAVGRKLIAYLNEIARNQSNLLKKIA